MGKQFIAVFLIFLCITIQIYSKKNYKAYTIAKDAQVISAITSYLNKISGEGASFCWKDSYDRGVGTKPTSCPSGTPLPDGLCYNPCPSGYTAIGPICWNGLFNEIGRGGGTMPNSCLDGEEMNAGKCYTLCKSGYKGVSSVCRKYCTADTPYDCGAACSSNSDACTSDTVGIIGSVADVLVDILEMVNTLGGNSAVENSAELAMQAAYNTVKILISKGADNDSIKAAMKAGASKAGEVISDAALDTIVDISVGNDSFNWSDFSTLDPTGIATAVLSFAKSVC